MPAPPRDIRRLAFQVLFQLDARGERDAAAIRDAAQDHELPGLSDKDREKAFELAGSAYGARAAADRVMLELAPTWPSHRQAAVDRAILRLAYFEMTSGRTPPKVAVNEAVELAKEFSTDKSPAFVNGLLDKVLKRVLSAAAKASEATVEPAETAPEPASGPGETGEAPSHPPAPSAAEGE